MSDEDLKDACSPSAARVEVDTHGSPRRMRSSSSFGQLLCSLPEAKPLTQFPVVLDSASSPPSSSRKLSGWGNINIPAFPTTDGWDGCSDEEDIEVDNGGAFVPASTDSLIQGTACGAHSRGGPVGIRIKPKTDTDLSDVSPWPSTGSAAGFQAAYGGLEHGRLQAGGGVAQPVLQPMSAAAIPDVSPWPSRGLLVDPHAPPCQEANPDRRIFAGVGVHGGVGMAPLKGNQVDMSPCEGQGLKAGPTAALRGQALAPLPGNNVDMSPFPSSSDLKGARGGARRGDMGKDSLSVLRQAADALNHQVVGAAAATTGWGSANFVPSDASNQEPSPLVVRRAPRQGGGGSTLEIKNLLPNPSLSPDPLTTPFGGGVESESATTLQDGRPPVSGIIFSPTRNECPQTAPVAGLCVADPSARSQDSFSPRQSQKAGTTVAPISLGPEKLDPAPPPVSGIIFCPPTQATAAGTGGRDTEVEGSNGDAGVTAGEVSGVEDVTVKIRAMVSRLEDDPLESHAFRTLKELHALLQSKASISGGAATPASGLVNLARQEVLKGQRSTERVATACARGLCSAADDTSLREVRR